MLSALESPTRFCSLFVNDFPKQGMDSRPLPVETVSFTDRCAHRQIQSLAHLQCTHRRKRRPGKQGKKGQHLPAKNHWCRRENENTPLRRSNAPTERTCLLSIQKTVHRKTGAPGKTVSPPWTCGRPSVHVRCHCTGAIKNFPHAFARCVFELTSHLAHCIS